MCVCTETIKAENTLYYVSIILMGHSEYTIVVLNCTSLSFYATEVFLKIFFKNIVP